MAFPLYPYYLPDDISNKSEDQFDLNCQYESETKTRCPVCFILNEVAYQIIYSSSYAECKFCKSKYWVKLYGKIKGKRKTASGLLIDDYVQVYLSPPIK